MTTERPEALRLASDIAASGQFTNLFTLDAAAAELRTQPQAGAVPLTGEYPALVCDYCGALTPDPWHSSGMLHGKMSKHIHSCDACAARGVAKAHLETAKNNLPIGSKENP